MGLKLKPIHTWVVLSNSSNSSNWMKIPTSWIYPLYIISPWRNSLFISSDSFQFLSKTMHLCQLSKWNNEQRFLPVFQQFWNVKVNFENKFLLVKRLSLTWCSMSILMELICFYLASIYDNAKYLPIHSWIWFPQYSTKHRWYHDSHLPINTKQGQLIYSDNQWCNTVKLQVQLGL